MLIAQATEHTDSEDSAFVHALAMAARSGAKLVSLHVAHGVGPEAALPSAGELLARWGRSPQHVEHERSVLRSHDDVPDALIDALQRLRPDLLVLSTHARGGLRRLLADSVAEDVARNIDVPTLLLPLGAPGFVDAQSGAVDLGSMLVVAGTDADAQRAVDAAALLARLAGHAGGELLLLHAADGTRAPAPNIPIGFSAVQRVSAGTIEDAVVACAADSEPCVVVMTSHGHDGIGDVLLASHTERVLHRVRRPLLWVPAPATP